MKTKKLLSGILALIMIFSMSINAFALTESSGVYESGGSESVPVTLNVAPAIFSVTVPSVLPVSVTADGEVVCAESGEARIINYSHGAVKVTNLEIDAINGWETVDFDNANMHKVPLNSRLFAFTINNEKTTGADTITFDESNFPVLDGANDTDSDELVIDYDALIAPQNAAVVDMDIANIVFTIAWEELGIPLKFGEKYILTTDYTDGAFGTDITFFENGSAVSSSENEPAPEGYFSYTASQIFCDGMPDELKMYISPDGKNITFVAEGETIVIFTLESEIDLITFTIDNESYFAIAGMTWGEWIESPYNTLGLKLGAHYLNDDTYSITDFGQDKYYELEGVSGSIRNVDLVMENSIYIGKYMPN